MRYKDYKGKTGSYRWINKHTKEIVEIVTRNIGKAIKRDLELGFNLDDFNIEVNAYPIPEEVKIVEQDEPLRIPRFYKFYNSNKNVMISIYKLTADKPDEIVSDDFDKLKILVKQKFDYDIQY